jgi:transcriptional regulator
MYTPSAFELTDLGSQHQIIYDYPLGTVISHGTSGLVATHLPFFLDTSAPNPGTLQAHIARNNAEFFSLPDESPVLVVFQGPHAYISPSWYPSKAITQGKAVPTWNYVSVHVHGTLTIKADQAWLRRHLAQQTARYEDGRPNPWSIEDAPPDYIDMMLQHIAGVEISITRIEGKQKLSQNRPVGDRQEVIQELNNPLQPIIGSTFGREIARLMQDSLDSK